MACEILTGGVLMTFVPYGELWRRFRRAAHADFNHRGVEKYRPGQLKEAAALISDLLADPESWVEHVKRSAASSILTAVYGWPRLAKDDVLVAKIHAQISRLANSVLPGAYLVEIFPIMKRLPNWLAKWKREGEEWHRKDTEMFEGFMNGVSEKIIAGDTSPTFVASLVENQVKYGLTRKQTAWLAGTMFGAGAETTGGSMIVFVLAMTLYPEVMRKAQAELDAVVGRDRLPTFNDEPNLPYIRAILKETLRWRPVGPLGVPRRTSEDDWYEGYFIPKGAMVLANIWAMNRDPTIFPDFDEFRPERFLDSDGKTDRVPPDTHNMGHVNFGFGRRMCAGYNFANQSMFINIATMLWALNIDQALDAHGNPIVPDKNDVSDAGAVVVPTPFPCRLTARSPEVLQVLRLHSGR